MKLTTALNSIPATLQQRLQLGAGGGHGGVGVVRLHLADEKAREGEDRLERDLRGDPVECSLVKFGGSGIGFQSNFDQFVKSSVPCACRLG